MTIGTGNVAEFDALVAMPLRVLGDQLVYVSQSGGLMAVRFDNTARRPVGDPVQLDEGVVVDQTAGAKASLSASGTLAYLRGRAQFQPVMAGAGSTSPVALIREPGSYSTPRFSPEGGRVAMTVFGTNATDIWIYNIARNTFTRLTTEGVNVRPEWTADGRYVVFISTREGKSGIWRQPADGSGAAELLYQPEIEPFEAIVSPDMKWLVFRTAPGAKHSRDILAVPLTGDRTVVPIVTGPNSESLPRLSPDGKWLAYQSNETDRFEIYVRPFPGSGARVQVSDNGGTEPIWGRSGRLLYFRGPLGEVVQVGVTTGSGFSIGTRSVVLTGDYLTDSSHPNWDVAPDGRFLMLKRAGAESQTVVVHNWGSELREKTAARK
ncbi:MAG: PD40 domain-containing protein [Gemmatimonadaceae bacterium]|nr:PD40 domain-containing protein [Gemmatimonadaceae bacterium]